jgi:uncharacterized protein (TIGR02145 family)
MFCQNCGNKIKSNINICSKCGFNNKNRKIHKSRKVIIYSLIFFVSLIISSYILIYFGYIKLPKNIETFFQRYKIIPQYIGNDLVNGSIKYREEGAKNLEAYIQDERDGKKYRIVKMADGNWWMAENLNYQKDLVMNERADFANGKPIEDSTNGTQGIGSFWCNDFEYFRWDLKALEILNNEKDMEIKSFQYSIRFGGDGFEGFLDADNPPTREQVISRFPGVNGSGNKLKRENICNAYGALYTWETAMSVNGKGNWDENSIEKLKNTQNICPEGWRIPTDFEWTSLLNTIEENSIGLKNHDKVLHDWAGKNSGILLKSSQVCSNCSFSDTDPKWDMNNSDQNFTGLDFYGFNIVPTGYLNNKNWFYYRYKDKGYGAYFWTSSEYNKEDAYIRIFSSQRPGTFRGFFHKLNAMSVRCIKSTN